MQSSTMDCDAYSYESTVNPLNITLLCHTPLCVEFFITSPASFHWI